MPAPITEPPPAEATNPVVPPPGTDPKPDAVPASVSTLMKNLNLLTEPEQPSEKPKDDKSATTPAPKADAKPDDGSKPKPDGAKPAAEPTPEPGMRLRKPKVTRPDLPIETPKPAAAAATPAPEAYKPDAQWESGLDDTEKEMLADARFMEERFPDKYKGWAARTAKFIKDHAAETARDTFDANSPEYKAWLDKNQPRLSRDQIREIEEVRVADRVKKEYDGKLGDLQHKLFVREHEPKIESEGRTIFSELSNSCLPDEVAESIKKDGFDKASESFGLEIETAQNVLGAATADIVEFKRISTRDPETGRPLQEEVTDTSHPKFAQHQRLNKMVYDICEAYKNNAPAEQQLRNGKWFVTRDEWNMIRPDQRNRFWTFTNAELIDGAKKGLKAVVGKAIEQKREYFTKFGYTRAPKEAPKPAAPPKSEPPQPTNTPRVPAATPAPGPTDPMSEIDARAQRMAAQLSK